MFKRAEVIISPSECINHFRSYEGSVSHFYLNTLGVPSIGIGCPVRLKEDAMGLELYNNYDNHSATFQEKVEEWERFRTLETGKDVLYYHKRSSYYARNTFLELLFTRSLQNIINEIRDKVCDLEEFKPLAQVVLLDMAFSQGVKKLTTEFQRFIQAFLLRDYAGAALSCERDFENNARNNWARETLMQLQKEKIS